MKCGVESGKCEVLSLECKVWRVKCKVWSGETRDETSCTIKMSISCETSSNLILCSFKIDVFLQVFLRTDLKIDVSCEASVDFHHLS